MGILVGDGAGGFLAVPRIPGGGFFTGVSGGGRLLTEGDFNNDGLPDVAVSDPVPDSVRVLLNTTGP